MVGVGCHITAGDSGIATVILGGQSFVQHERSVKQPPMRGSERRRAIAVAIHAPRGPGR